LNLQAGVDLMYNRGAAILSSMYCLLLRAEFKENFTIRINIEFTDRSGSDVYQGQLFSHLCIVCFLEQNLSKTLTIRTNIEFTGRGRF
jgi:hypothetical protein